MSWQRWYQDKAHTLWKGRDAEGRTCFAVTRDREGVSVEPTGANIYYSGKVAWEAAGLSAC